MLNEPLEKIAVARSFLFVPGDRPERFEKAFASKADIVILDLEDAVAPENKVAARATVANCLSFQRPAVVRINAVDTPWHVEDIRLCQQQGVLGIMVPKAEAGAALTHISNQIAVVALIESAKGVSQLNQIAATTGVSRLAFGTIDLALDLRISDPDLSLESIGLQLVVASRAAGIAPPIAGVTVALNDTNFVEEVARREVSRGFGGKLCIHPSQIPPVHNAFLPTEAELEWASQVISLSNAARGAAVAFEGSMIDRPLVERARSIQVRGFRDH